MKILSKAEASRWCEQKSVHLSASGLPEPSDVPTRFNIPADAQKRVHLVDTRMRAFVDAPVLLVWFDDWGVWSGQRMHVFDRFRLSYGETRPLIDSPGHLFERAEFEDAVSFVTLAVLFLWDCYVVTPGRTKFLFFSHDEIGLTNEAA